MAELVEGLLGTDELGLEALHLDALDVDPGGTPFQGRVWQMLRRIPAGTTWSYAQLAAAIGEPTAVRAVASANARNPATTT